MFINVTHIHTFSQNTRVASDNGSLYMILIGSPSHDEGIGVVGTFKKKKEKLPPCINIVGVLEPKQN